MPPRRRFFEKSAARVGLPLRDFFRGIGAGFGPTLAIKFTSSSRLSHAGRETYMPSGQRWPGGSWKNVNHTAKHRNKPPVPLACLGLSGVPPPKKELT